MNMTNLEILLIATIWIMYGVFSGYRWNEIGRGYTEEAGIYVVCILFSPAVFIVRIIAGIFWVELKN